MVSNNTNIYKTDKVGVYGQNEYDNMLKGSMVESQNNHRRH